MDRTGGWINGFLGVLIFSGSLRATRVAVANFDPLFLTVARAAIAGILALCLLLAFREKRPARADLFSLLVVSLGVVIGFPLLTAFALKHITSAPRQFSSAFCHWRPPSLACCAATSATSGSSGRFPASAAPSSRALH